MLFVHVFVVAIGLIANAHSRSLSAANDEPLQNSDANYAYDGQQSDEYAEQPAPNSRQVRQAPNEEQGYDKDYAQENLNEDVMTPSAQKVQYPAKLNGDDEDMEVAPKKEVAAVNRKSHNRKIKDDEAKLNEDAADQQEEESIQRQNVEAGDEAKEAAEDTYRSPRENPGASGPASELRNAAAPVQAQRQDDDSDEAAVDTVDKVAGDYQNANEPANVQQLVKSETSAGNAGAQTANNADYKEYAQEEEETDPAGAEAPVEVNKDEAAPAQYEQVNQPE